MLRHTRSAESLTRHRYFSQNLDRLIKCVRSLCSPISLLCEFILLGHSVVESDGCTEHRDCSIHSGMILSIVNSVRVARCDFELDYRPWQTSSSANCQTIKLLRISWTRRGISDDFAAKACLTGCSRYYHTVPLQLHKIFCGHDNTLNSGDWRPHAPSRCLQIHGELRILD
jgi:hypothetical protein